jgi:hypothetical protein
MANDKDVNRWVAQASAWLTQAWNGISKLQRYIDTNPVPDIQVKGVVDSDGNNLVNPVSKIAVIPEIPEQIIPKVDDVQTADRKSIVKNKIAILPPWPAEINVDDKLNKIPVSLQKGGEPTNPDDAKYLVSDEYRGNFYVPEPHSQCCKCCTECTSKDYYEDAILRTWNQYHVQPSPCMQQLTIPSRGEIWMRVIPADAEDGSGVAWIFVSGGEGGGQGYAYYTEDYTADEELASISSPHDIDLHSGNNIDMSCSVDITFSHGGKFFHSVNGDWHVTNGGEAKFTPGGDFYVNAGNIAKLSGANGVELSAGGDSSFSVNGDISISNSGTLNLAGNTKTVLSSSDIYIGSSLLTFSTSTLNASIGETLWSTGKMSFNNAQDKTIVRGLQNANGTLQTITTKPTGVWEDGTGEDIDRFPVSMMKLSDQDCYLFADAILTEPQPYQNGFIAGQVYYFLADEYTHSLSWSDMYGVINTGKLKNCDDCVALLCIEGGGSTSGDMTHGIVLSSSVPKFAQVGGFNG